MYKLRAVAIFTLIFVAASPVYSSSSNLQKLIIPSSATVQTRARVIWEDGFEDADEAFPSWDAFYSDSKCAPSSTDISTAQVHGGSYAVKFNYQPDGSEWARRLGLFIHHQVPASIYENGFYWSFWYYVPSDIDSWIGDSFAIGGLKWYFLDYQWSYGTRWRLYYSSSYGTTRVHVDIAGDIYRGHDLPQEGYDYDPPSEHVYYSAINKGAWNHFQLYLKSTTDTTGRWDAWVNNVEITTDTMHNINGNHHGHDAQH